MYKSLIIIGAGGHGKVILDLATKAGFTVDGFLDDVPIKGDILGYHYLGTVSDIDKFADDHIFICAIGENSARMRIDKSKEVEWATIIHPNANIGLDVKIGEGTVVMAGGVINASAYIGRSCIINTSAVIEHDCVVSDYVHISPGAVLCGAVQIGELSWIGAGVTVKNGVSIYSGVIVGAGAVVVNDITEKGVYYGVPARRQYAVV